MIEDLAALETNYSYQVTQRFLEAVKILMGHYKTGKITQKEIGDITGVNSSNISRMKLDKARYVSLEAVCRLCAYYKISTFWILLGEGQMWANDELLSAYRTLETRLGQLETAFKDIEKSIEIIRSNSKKKN